MNLHTPEYRIIYNNKNITKDVSDYLLSLTYSDKAQGESDEIELEFHDKDLLWQNDWYPLPGLKLTVQIIDGDVILDCGSFTIDENEYKSSRSDADAFSIRGMAASVTQALRSKKSTAHENKTLRELCNTIASNHGLKVQGTIADIRISRITQYQESDLTFLDRISKRYGYTFSIRDGIMVFTSDLDLYSKPHAVSVDKTECTDFSFKHSTKEVMKEVTVAYHNPTTNKVVTKTVERKDTRSDLEKLAAKALDVATIDDESDFNTENTGDFNLSADNEQQAEEMANAIMRKSIVTEETCTVACKGNVLIITGNQVELTGFGRFSGIYYIVESSHSLDRQGAYVTSFTANKTGKVPKSKHKPKKKKKSTDDYLPVEGPDYNEDSDNDETEE
jgi:phage protein D